MKILFTSYFFSPSIGGIETVSEALALEFVRAGHEVRLVTTTRNSDLISRPFEVIRAPGPVTLLKLTRWADVVFQNNISLELAWPLFVVRRPWIVAHQVWLNSVSGPGKWRFRLKNLLLRFACNASISRPIAEALPVPSVVIGNPYEAAIFKIRPEIARTRELVYLGRLVSDKGVDLLLQALAELRKWDMRPRLTIIGSGPEEDGLKAMADHLQIADQIEFTGSKKGEDLVRILNQHQIMVIPSRWAEPFGIVALEGIACGCALVASRLGGLPEAVGPCGIFFEAGNAKALADALLKALTVPHFREDLQREAQTHLEPFTPFNVAQRYLRLFEGTL